MMTVFLPGTATGPSAGDNPLAVKFLTVHNTDVKGPLTPGYLLIKGILAEDDTLVGVAAFRRKNEQTPDLDRESMVDLTDCVENGWLKWNVPEGLWRILVFYETHHGNGKLDYFNILDSQSVKQLLERVYQPHYDHYGEEFGTVFQGFFSDEPEFSNLPWYDFQARLGKDMQFIPWSEELKSRLKKRWKDAFLKNLAELWYETGEWTPHVRYDYMDETTLQLSQSFSGQIGDWCEAHKVSHIGHIIEDDNSHGRLGCSTGHYFRSLSDMRMAGIDVVLQQVMPEMDQEEHQWVASSRDGEFFHYGLGNFRGLWLAGRHRSDEMAGRSYVKPWNQPLCSPCIFHETLSGPGLPASFLCPRKSDAVFTFWPCDPVYEPGGPPAFRGKVSG